VVIACDAFSQPAPVVFEVASVKPADPNGHPGVGIDMRTSPGGRLSATDCTLKQLIRGAYGLEPWKVVDGPAWIDTDRFDIEAKAGEDFSKDTDRVIALGHDAPRKMMTMLQALLAERFHVKVHRETREDTIYSLVVAKNGPKLQAATGVEPPFIGMRRTGVTLILAGDKASMAILAERLSYWVLHRPVLDKTGSPGTSASGLSLQPTTRSPMQVPRSLPPFRISLASNWKPAKGRWSI
jgi:uncharacterized protein (TIGR03435 family)